VQAVFGGRGVNPASIIEYSVNEMIHKLSLQQSIGTYMQTSEEAKMVFMTALRKAMGTNSMGIQKFFEGMGKLLLMSQFSDQDITAL